jgi:L-ascorbate metabolism protein UlaG (beta-lactamase superfamily)
MHEMDAHGVRRRLLIRGMLAVGATFSLASCTTTMAQMPPRGASAAGAKISARWLGGGVMELATPDYKQIAYIDAWIWNNTGWERFGIAKPAEYASKDGFVRYVAGKKPDAVFVLLTHDHGDHMGDFFEMLQGLAAAGVPVKAAGQSDLMRKGLVDDFKHVGLDPAKIVVNNGAAMNFGGVGKHGAMTAYLVPAIHSNLHGYPSACFIVDIGGVRVYASGDTDLFGDMKLIGERYHPNLAIVCVGDGPFTMGPEDAARACQWTGVSQAIPVHYAHNPLVKGVEAGDEFRRALATIAPGIAATVLKPGEARVIQI